MQDALDLSDAVHDVCILFLHHRDDELTRYHLGLTRASNPGVPVVPLSFGKGVSGSISVGKWCWPVRDEWYANDVMVYAWYKKRAFRAKRYVIFDYDTLCLMPVESFYQQVWNADVACASPMTYQEKPEWYWFRAQSVDGLPLKFHEQLAGLAPASGVFLSDRALKAISELAKDRSFSHLFCECRLGTLARIAGFEIRQIRDDVEQFIGWNEVTPTRRGIWHPIKTIYRSDDLFLASDADSV